MSDEAITRELPTEADRRRKPILFGPEFETTDGQTWTLPNCGLDGPPELADLREKVYVSAVTRQSVDSTAARVAVLNLLHEHYELADAEAALIVLSTTPDALAQAAYESLCSAIIPRDIGLGDWARTGLIANGIVPAHVNRDDLALVLDHLVEANRIAPHQKFTDAGRVAAKRRSILGSAPGPNQ